MTGSPPYLKKVPHLLWLLPAFLSLSLRLWADSEPPSKALEGGWCSRHGNWSSGYECPGCASERNQPNLTPAIADPNVARLSALSPKFFGLAKEMDELGVRFSKAYRSLPPPKTIEELQTLLQQLHGDAARHKNRLASDLEQNRRDFERIPQNIASLMGSIDRLNMELQELPAKIDRAQETMETCKRTAETEMTYERYFASRESASAQIAAESEAKSVRTIQFLLPADQRDAFLAKLRDTPLPPGFRAQPALEFVNRADIAQATRIPEIAGPAPSALIQVTTPSTPEACIESLEDMRGALADLGPAVESQNRRLAPLREKFQQLGNEQYALQRKHSPLSAKLMKLEKDIDGYAKIAEEALHNQRIFAQNTLKHAAVALVWDYVYDNAIKPELTAILENNNLHTGMEMVETLKKIRDNPEEMIPRLGPLRDMPRLITTMRLVASIEPEFENWAARAAEALAQPGNQTAQHIAQELFPAIDKKGLEIIKTASDSMDGTVEQLAQAIARHAPKY